MMPYTVTFAKAAISQLADVWIEAIDKQSVASAEDRIERELRRDPKAIGRHLSEGLWLAELPPILVFFEISEDDQLVYVTEVRMTE